MHLKKKIILFYFILKDLFKQLIILADETLYTCMLFVHTILLCHWEVFISVNRKAGPRFKSCFLASFLTVASVLGGQLLGRK